MLSIGPVSLWLGPAAALDVVETLARAIAVAERGPSSAPRRGSFGCTASTKMFLTSVRLRIPLIGRRRSEATSPMKPIPAEKSVVVAFAAVAGLVAARCGGGTIGTGTGDGTGRRARGGRGHGQAGAAACHADASPGGGGHRPARGDRAAIAAVGGAPAASTPARPASSRRHHRLRLPVREHQPPHQHRVQRERGAARHRSPRARGRTAWCSMFYNDEHAMTLGVRSVVVEDRERHDHDRLSGLAARRRSGQRDQPADRHQHARRRSERPRPVAAADVAGRCSSPTSPPIRTAGPATGSRAAGRSAERRLRHLEGGGAHRRHDGHARRRSPSRPTPIRPRTTGTSAGGTDTPAERPHQRGLRRRGALERAAHRPATRTASRSSSTTATRTRSAATRARPACCSARAAAAPPRAAAPTLPAPAETVARRTGAGRNAHVPPGAAVCGPGGIDPSPVPSRQDLRERLLYPGRRLAPPARSAGVGLLMNLPSPSRAKRGCGATLGFCRADVRQRAAVIVTARSRSLLE